jgi:hypothetical protein
MVSQAAFGAASGHAGLALIRSVSRGPAPFLLLNLFAAGFYVLVGWQSGNLAHPDVNVFQSYDSQTYRAVADWIFQVGANPEASSWRPFLYPLLLGLADRAGGAGAVWLLNVAFWFATLNIAAAAAYRLVKSYWAAIVVFLALATNVSLILLTFQGVTEITVGALLAIWIYGLSHLTRRPTPSQALWAFLPLTLVVVVKPEFELLLALVAVVLLVLSVRGPTPALSGVALAACLIPVAIQVWAMARFNHYLGLSSIGDSTLRGFYVARLYVTIGYATDLQAARLQVQSFSNPEVARLVFAHGWDAIRVFFTTLKDNLLAGSNFILPSANPILNRVVVWTNRAYVLVLVAMIPLVGAALWRARDGRLALLCLAILNILLAGGLSFDQGDRLTVIALPLCATALVLAIARSGLRASRHAGLTVAR